MPDLLSQRSDSAPAPRAGRFEILGAWLHVWTPPRGVTVPAVPWRKVAAGGAVVAIVLTGLGLWLVPRIEHAKHAQASRTERSARRLIASERRRLVEDQTLHQAQASGLPPLGAPASLRRRTAALVTDLEASITADARARVRAGSLEGPIARTSCQPYRNEPAAARLPTTAGLPATKYDCTAVTGTTRTRTAGNTVNVSVGYPFWARVDVRAGSYVWCKINPGPGEQAIGLAAASVPLPRACDLTAG